MFRKLLSLALCLCMALTLTSAVAEGTSFTVTDMTGRELNWRLRPAPSWR